MFHYGRHYRLRQTNGHCIAELSKRLAPCAMQRIAVRESLNPCCLPHGVMTQRAVGVRNHVLAARHAMIAGLECLRRLVEGRSGVPPVGARTPLIDVVKPSGCAFYAWRRHAGQCFSDGHPGQQSVVDGLAAHQDALMFGNVVLFPVSPGVLAKRQRAAAVGGLGERPVRGDVRAETNEEHTMSVLGARRSRRR